MANLKEVRLRIESVKSTQQITSAMKMVYAAKFRKTQSSILKLRPYSAKLTEILQNVVSADTENIALAHERPVVHSLLIVVTSNKGLCGSFNSAVIKAAVAHIESHYAKAHQEGKLSIITIGKKATEYFTKRKYNVIDSLDELLDHLSFNATVPFSEQLMTEFISKKYDNIEIIYNRLKNAATQILTIEPFLPIKIETQAQTTTKADYIFEPEKQTILENLIPQTLKTQVYKILLDSLASEHGARMTAMSKATDNAQELLKDLKISYNKARQAAITNEIIEIVSGANAL